MSTFRMIERRRIGFYAYNKGGLFSLVIKILNCSSRWCLSIHCVVFQIVFKYFLVSYYFFLIVLHLVEVKLFLLHLDFSGIRRY